MFSAVFFPGVSWIFHGALSGFYSNAEVSKIGMQIMPAPMRQFFH